VASQTTLKAVASLGGWSDSGIATAVYSFAVPTPAFSVAGGSYTGPQSVTLAVAAPAGASIRYTLDGSAPTETASTLYTAGATIPIASTTTIEAMAYAATWADSAVASVTYTITVDTPMLTSPANQAVGRSATPTLSWQAATGATSCTVHLDTVNPPQHHYTVAGTSFTPSAALQGSDLYYWYVVGISGPATGPASALSSFWVTGAASAVSVTPASGGPPSTGLGTPTTFTFASPNGWQDIAWTEMLFS
jgi:hypothetical protein